MVPRIIQYAAFAFSVAAILTAIGLAPSTASAVDRPIRTVVLKDGRTYTGPTDELIDSSVRVESEGQTRVFAKDEVDAVLALVPADERVPPAQEGDFEFGLGAGFAVAAGASQYGNTQLRLQTFGGYFFTDLFQLGYDIGVQTGFDSEEPTLVDLALALTFNFGNSPDELRPFGYLQVTGGVEVASFSDETSVGPLAGIGGGLKLPISSEGAFLIGLSYHWSQHEYSAQLDALIPGDSDLTIQTHRLSFDTGFAVYF